jgi:predicted ribosome quality control (RQC) complex YloA/Tae2 family protein
VTASQGEGEGDREPPRAPRGLSAAELALVLAELEAELLGAQVVDVARRSDADDLLVFLAAADRKRALHVVPAGARARVTTTVRRFAKEQLATGPRVDALRQRLVGTRLFDVAQPGGERVCRLTFRGASGDVVLVAELFGARGLWCLLDEQGRITEMSRLPHSAQRALAPGAPYSPPPPHRAPAPPPPPRFAAPLCAAVDKWFTAHDLEAERAAARERLELALERARRRCRDRLAGLERQDAEAARAPELRRTADLMLSYAHTVQRGDPEMVVPDPERADAALRIALDPAHSVPAQAKSLYARARKLEQATAMVAQRRAESERELAELDALAARLAAASGDAELADLEAELRRRGALPKPQGPPAPPPQVKKITKGENFRRFTSSEGHLILVGRTNQQNDKLSLRVARGNDVWLHVGQGNAGSHVVVRLPREKTASLETLLDAATLAIHFSKARGNPRCDVIYTFCKHVRKPKGAPAGSVVATHTKTLTVRHEASRLARVLATSQTNQS